MKKIVYLFFAAVTVLALAACQSDKETGKTNDTTDSNADGEKTLTVVYSSTLTDPDPQGLSSAPRKAVDVNVFNTLFRLDDNMEIQPEIVESYEMIDETTLNIKLIEGIKFHNGDELTAEDVKFSIERVAHDEGHVEYTFFEPIKGVDVIDEYNLNVLTYEPTPVLLHLLSKHAAEIIPKNYMEENGLEYFLENPVGSGPYKYVEWIKDDRVVLERYDDYFVEDYESDWDKVVVRTIPESTTRVGELLTGGAHIIEDVPPNEWDRIESADGVSLVRGDSSRVIMLVLRTADENSPLSDPKVREAIDLAINKEVISEDVLKGSGSPVRTRSPLGVFGAHPELADSQIYDLEKAKQLLAEAGYPDGIDVTMQAPTGGYLLIEDVAEIIVQMLGEAGINVTLEQRQVNALLEELQIGENSELSLIGYSHAYPDAIYAMSSYYSGRGERSTGYNNPEFDELYHDSLSNLDMDEREANLHKMQEIVAEDRPYIHLYQQLNNVGLSDEIEFSPRMDENIHFDRVKIK